MSEILDVKMKEKESVKKSNISSLMINFNLKRKLAKQKQN